MTKSAYLDVGRHHDFLMLFDVTGGNPNGDPDNGNAPVTGQVASGLVVLM